MCHTYILCVYRHGENQHVSSPPCSTGSSIIWCPHTCMRACLTLYRRTSQKSVADDQKSLDTHCATNAQRIFTNEVSFERSLHDLNADTFVLKIRQEITPEKPFEVTKLFDFAVERSTSVGRGRNFAHCIAMETRNVAECIQQMTARRQAVDSRKNELRSCFTGQEQLAFFLGSRARKIFSVILAKVEVNGKF